MIAVSEARRRTGSRLGGGVAHGGSLRTTAVLGVVFGETPCILGWAERTSTALMALAGIVVLRYGGC